MRTVRPLVLAALVICGTTAAFGAPTPQVAPTPLPSASPQPAPTVAASPTPSNPFASPTPYGQVVAGANGYAVLFVESASGSGGTYVPAGSTAAPIAFPASSGRGFTIDVTGRLSRVFAGSLRIQDDSLHGGDNPISTVTEGALLYGSQRTALGIGVISFQRSSGITSATGAGLGVALAPDEVRSISLFGKIFFYPSLQFPAIGTLPTAHAVRSSFFTYQTGLAFAPPARGGLFYSVGIAGHAGAPSAYSPQSLTAFQLGVGTRF
jgi:hypothetical protein